jgi:hypothetical protein
MLINFICEVILMAAKFDNLLIYYYYYFVKKSF